MHCNDIQDLITAEVDGELASEARARLQEHLGECATCRAEFELEQSTKSFLKRHLKHVDTPRLLRSQIATQLTVSAIPHIGATGWLRNALRLGSPRPTLALGASLGLILILLMLAPSKARHSHTQPADANIIHQTFNNFDGVLSGKLTPEIASDDPTVILTYMATRVNFSVNLPRCKRYRLIGGVCSHFNDEPVANVVYRKDRDLIYLYEANFRCVERGGHLNLPAQALEQLHATGWYIESPLPECTLAVWVVDSTVCCAVGDIAQDKMLAFLKDTQ